MKKNIISALAVTALAMLATSCSSELDGLTANNSKENLVHVTFNATQETGVTSRTSLQENTNDYSVNWTQGDQVMIYDGTDWHPFTALTGGSTTTTLDGSLCSSRTAEKAVYMGSSYSETQSSISYVLPKEQTATNGSFDPKANLMYVPEINGTTLTFKQTCSYLKLTTTKEYKKIVLTTNVDIAGEGYFEYDQQNSYWKFFPSTTAGADVSKSVTLLPASGSTTIAAGTYYIAIAPVTATKITTDCYTSDTECEELALSGSFSLARGKVNNLGSTSDDGWKTKTFAYATINGVQTPVECVQLWANGPKFAAFNVGATITDYKNANSTSSTASEKYQSPDYVGGYYGWGGSTSCSSTDYYSGTEYDANGNLESDHDTATKLWGNNWRMPTKDELTYLGAGVTISSGTGTGTYCKWTWCTGESGSQYVEGCTLAGYKIEGLGAYASNSVFFPAAGYYDMSGSKVSGQGSCGLYWSSTPSNSLAYDLYFTSDQHVYDYYRYAGGSVRAVLR